MKKIQCPLKRIEVVQLQAELTAAGVVYDTSSRWGCVVAYPDHLLLSVADDADAKTVRAVVAAHVAPPEKTEAEIKRTAAKQLIADNSPRGIRDRVRDKLTVEAIQALMAWCNGLRRQLIDAGLPVTVPRLEARTWEQLEDRVRELIDIETTEVKP